MNKRQVGTQYESMAVQYLTEAGYHILERNFRCRTGEIDIIAKDGAYLVFVEVKTRSTLAFGDPLEAIDRRKVKKYRKMAEEYIIRSRLFDKDVRFDAVGIVGDSINYVPDAF